MGGTKVLDLRRNEDVSSGSDEETRDSATKKRARNAVTESPSATEESGSDDDEDEFEIPPGFEGITGSSAITRESVLPSSKQLWLFKLPKEVDATALAGASFKLRKTARAGHVATHVTHDGKTYRLQHEDAVLSQQLVNAFPDAKNRHKFVLGKPFARCFSLLVDPLASMESSVAAEEPSSARKSKKSKREATPDKASSKKSKRKASH